ncbi:hypothetical protein NUM3379_26150 [Kineococcus sp. NUM-3379]
MSTTRPVLHTVLLAGVLALSACSGAGGTGAEAGSPAATPSASATEATTQATPSAPAEGAGQGAVDGEAQFEAVKTASGAMAAYADADADPAAWHAGISGYVTPELAESLRGTDPSTLGVRQITGNSEVVLVDGPTSVRVDVPTDAGSFSLGLTRSDAASPVWKVTEIIPVE